MFFFCSNDFHKKLLEVVENAGFGENVAFLCKKLIYFRAGLKTSLDEGTPAATIQEPDLGRVFDVAAYGKLKSVVAHLYHIFIYIVYGKFILLFSFVSII